MSTSTTSLLTCFQGSTMHCVRQGSEGRGTRGMNEWGHEVPTGSPWPCTRSGHTWPLQRWSEDDRAWAKAKDGLPPAQSSLCSWLYAAVVPPVPACLLHNHRLKQQRVSSCVNERVQGPQSNQHCLADDWMCRLEWAQRALPKEGRREQTEKCSKYIRPGFVCLPHENVGAMCKCLVPSSRGGMKAHKSEERRGLERTSENEDGEQWRARCKSQAGALDARSVCGTGLGD